MRHYYLLDHWLIALVVMIIGLFCLPYRVQAVEVSPLRQTVVVNPGTSAEVEISVRNESVNDVTLRPRVDAYTIDDNGRAVFGQPSSALEWVRAGSEQYSVAAGETIAIPFSITVPASAEPGGHYLALFVASEPIDGTVRVESRVGSLLVLYVAGEVVERLDVAAIRSRAVLWGGSSTIQFELKNTGTIHIVPEGDVLVRNWRGGVVASSILNTKQRKVLPYMLWKDTIAISPSWTDAGPLTITANVSYGMTGQFVRAEQTIWFLPVQLFMLVGAGGVLLILVMRGNRVFNFHRGK